jgi:hypothetical protein
MATTSGVQMNVFLTAALAAGELLAGEATPDVLIDDDIISQTNRFYEMASGRGADWSQSVKQLAVGALSVFRLRLVDMTLREHVMLLHVVEGGTRIRSHEGACYFYRNGAWLPFRGVMPESTLNRVKKFNLQLEGLFRSMSSATARTDSSVLNTVATLLTNHPDDLLSDLEWLSISAVPRMCRVPRDAPGADDDDMDDQGGIRPAEASGWPELVATALARTSCSLMRELLGKLIITHYIEWCETPSPKKSGFALVDACFMFDTSDQHLGKVSKSPDNDIYVFLPHSLCDPVEASAQQKLQIFWSTTFWSNDAALECQLAAMTLALRGRNVDRAFWSQGPGGVGQSLESHRVAALFGPLHGFLDLNIYYDDNELRKQSEHLFDKLVTTGQEAEDGRGGMKQDLKKKTHKRRPGTFALAVRHRYEADRADGVETIRNESCDELLWGDPRHVPVDLPAFARSGVQGSLLHHPANYFEVPQPRDRCR